jgi:REP element-mobilizing transposase RayT
VLLEASGNDFQMQAWVVMPNHVHRIVDVWGMPLAKLVDGWKGKSAFLANRLLGRRGKLWQEDYFDTLIRDEAHLKKAARYTENNPTKAALVRSPRDWPWSSAPRRDQYERLPWQRG